MRRLLAPLIAAPFVFAGLPAFAQGNPSADQIIKSLKPSGNLISGGTRGIRLAPPTGAPAAPQSVTPAAASVPAPATAQAPRTHVTASHPAPAPVDSAPSVNLTVNFANGSAELTPDAMATLDQLGKALSSSDLASFRFRIEGHTDTVGSRDFNRQLSERRAEAVVSYLASKFGVQPARLQAVGMGEDGLLVPTPPQTPEPRNRRVQVVNLGA